jgi:hypothetical protein
MICMVRQAQKLQYSCAWEAIKKIKKRLDNLMTGRTKRKRVRQNEQRENRRTHPAVAGFSPAYRTGGSVNSKGAHYLEHMP